MKKILRVGIASEATIRQRTLDIISGRITPGPKEPKVWFTSPDAFGRMLGPRNLRLISIIRRNRPSSVTELAKLSFRAKGNLSRTLKMLERQGLVRMDKDGPRRKRPVVDYRKITLELDLDQLDPEQVDQNVAA